MNTFSRCRHRYRLLVLAFLCLAGTGRADPTISVPAFKADYTVSRAGIPVGKAVLRLEYEDATRYRIHSSLRTNALASLLNTRRESEEVEGEFVDGLPRPLRYRAKRTGDQARTVSMEFDWERGKVTTVVDGKRSCLELGGPRTVDPLSLHLLIMLDLHKGTLANEYEVVGGDRLKTYRVQSLGETAISTPIGELTVLAVSRKRPKSKKTTTFWHAPELDFMPVQISRAKEGTEKSRLTIERLKR